MIEGETLGCDPFGVGIDDSVRGFAHGTGGIAALNHRLIAGIPPGCIRFMELVRAIAG
jgi:hypothetical protein